MSRRPSIERIVIVPDTHAPFHDVRALKLLDRAAKGFRPHGVVHMGDLGDNWLLSKYPKSDRGITTIQQEADGVKPVRQVFDDWEPRWKKITLGNHEDRLRIFLESNEDRRKLIGTTDIDKAYELSANGWEVTPYRDHTHVGKVSFTHDTGTGGKYATFKAMAEFQGSVVISHMHRLQYVVGGTAKGDAQVGAQFGWIGDFAQVDYMHRIKARTDWAHGFGIGYHEVKTGNVWLTPVPIVDYECIIEGKVYRA